jgi:hypothetical protein
MACAQDWPRVSPIEPANPMKIPALVLALTVLPASIGLAQNASEPGKSLLENEQIRVREIRLPPGSKQAAVPRPNTFLYALTDGAIVFSPPGRKAYELTFKAGEALWLPSQETATANEGDKEVRALLVELKSRPPAAVKKGKATRAKKSSKKPAAKN